MNSQIWWYLARSGGIVAWALLAASVLWGLAMTTRVLGPKPRPNWMLDLHRWLGGLALTFTGLHVSGLVLDSYVHFGPVEVLVPFTGDYRPTAVAWGIIGGYLLLAVQATSLLKKHMPHKAWRWTHTLSFPLFAVATVHGLTAGTDATGTLLWGSMLAASIAVLALTAARLDQVVQKRQDRLASRGGARPGPQPRRPSVPSGQAATRAADSRRPARPSSRTSPAASRRIDPLIPHR